MVRSTFMLSTSSLLLRAAGPASLPLTTYLPALTSPPPQFAGDAVVTFSEQYVHVSANGKEQSSAVGGLIRTKQLGWWWWLAWSLAGIMACILLQGGHTVSTFALPHNIQSSHSWCNDFQLAAGPRTKPFVPCLGPPLTPIPLLL